MTVPAARAVEREFSAYYKEAVAAEQEFRLSSLPGEDRRRYKNRLRQLHPSSMPYCGYRHAYETLVREEDPVVYSNFSSDYYMGVGTVAHTVLQKWLGARGQIAGDWKCVACQHVHEMQVKPKRCTKCKALDLTYEEVGGVWGKRVWWHKDGAFIDKKGKLWIIDYKTTSTSAVWEHRKTGVKFPYVSNKAQSEAYVILAEDKYKKPFAGWLLFYVARDSPGWTFVPVARSMDADRKAEIRQRLTANDRDFGYVLKLKDTPEKIGRLRRSKLCPNSQFYKDNVHDQYNPCPVAKACFSAEKAKKVFDRAFKGIPIVTA